MAQYQVVSWKDIPALVEARDGTDTITRPLSEKFHSLIDSLAMQLGVSESEAYLEYWSRSEPAERPGGAEEVATRVAAELEERFPEFITLAFGPR